MRRRALLGALGAISGLELVQPRLMAERLRESLLSALGTDDWHELATEYGYRFMVDAPGTFREQLTGDLLILRQAMTESDSIAMRLAAPRLMMLYGMTTANLGHASDAARWYRAARLAAKQVNDYRLEQWVRGREAFRRSYEGSAPNEVLSLANGVEDVEAKLATAQAYARLVERWNAEWRAHSHVGSEEAATAMLELLADFVSWGALSRVDAMTVFMAASHFIITGERGKLENSLELLPQRLES